MWGCSVWGQGFHLNICLIHWEWLYLAQLAGWSCRMPHKLRGANKPNQLYNWASQLQMNSCTYKTDLLSPLLQSASLFCFPRTNSGNKCHCDERFENFDARTHHQFCQSNSQIHQKKMRTGADSLHLYYWSAAFLFLCLLQVNKHMAVTDFEKIQSK